MMVFKGFISPKFSLKVKQATDEDLVVAMHLIADELQERKKMRNFGTSR